MHACLPVAQSVTHSDMDKLGLNESSDASLLLPTSSSSDDEKVCFHRTQQYSTGHTNRFGRIEQIVDDEAEGVKYNWSFFHVVFVCASLYIGLVLTNWDILRCALHSNSYHITSH